jgi:hypothetical protein
MVMVLLKLVNSMNVSLWPKMLGEMITVQITVMLSVSAHLMLFLVMVLGDVKLLKISLSKLLLIITPDILISLLSMKMSKLNITKSWLIYVILTMMEMSMVVKLSNVLPKPKMNGETSTVQITDSSIVPVHSMLLNVVDLTVLISLNKPKL